MFSVVLDLSRYLLSSIDLIGWMKFTGMHSIRRLWSENVKKFWRGAELLEADILTKGLGKMYVLLESDSLTVLSVLVSIILEHLH